MKIVGISGSPRKAGNTEFLLNEALAVAAEYGFQTERLLCSELNFDFCSDCGDCSKGKPCPNKDDMHKVLRAMQEAEGRIVASPVYFGNVTAQLKAIFDRTIPLRRQGFRLRNKIGCAIAVGGSRNGGQEKTWSGAALEFSGGEKLAIELRNTSEPQEFRFPKQKCAWVKLADLREPFPLSDNGIVEFEVVGKDAGPLTAE